MTRENPWIKIELIKGQLRFSNNLCIGLFRV